MTDKLNKLQIRAVVLDIIKSYKKEDDFTSALHLANLKKLNLIQDNNFVIEILLKELVATTDLELEAVKYILADFATLESVESHIWTLLQDKSISDSKKEIYLQLLRTFGGKIDVPLLMNCMQDFDSVVDQQTLSLLEIATVNPEAQIDFLDFLFSLKKEEQIQLIKSLQDDFPGDELANIISPCLRIRLSDEVKSEVIEILANSKSYLAVKPLKNYVLANENDFLKKLAIKALNQLQNSGVDITNEEMINLRENEICKASKFYKAYISQIDGCGNQGLIFSRITTNNKILMFSVVINSADGIMDCFGLHEINSNDFQKVISRFRANDIVVPISSSIAKYKLLNAEKVNNLSGTPIPYEYLCWSVYTSDIESDSIDYDSLLTENICNFDKDLYEFLYESEVFDTWFFEYDDNREIQQLIDFLCSIKDKELNQIFLEIEAQIDDRYFNIFNPEKIEEYSIMLMEAAYIFYLNKDLKRSNIVANLSVAIKNGEMKFLKDVLRRSILQYLANIIAEENEDKSQNPFLMAKSKNKNSFSKEKAYELLRSLEQKWDGMFFDE